MNKKYFIFLAFLMSVFFPGACFTQDKGGEEKVFAVQERIFHRDHELSFCFGYIPDDDFYSVFPVGIGYTYHFNDFLAWEVARGQYLVTQEKHLKKTLEGDYGVTPSEFLEPQYMVHSNLMIKPFYGKESIWNRSIINQESYFLLGGGIVNYKKRYSFGTSGSETAPSLCFGYGVKYFLSKSLAMNLELRDLVNFKKEKTENNVDLGMSLSYRFNLSPRKTEQDETVDKLKQLLEEKERHE
jgi:outer membrane beta-barrel protein